MNWIVCVVVIFSFSCGSTQSKASTSRENSSATENVVSASLKLLEDMSNGNVWHADPDRGVVFVEYFSDASDESPEADENGLIRRSLRACGSVFKKKMKYLANYIHGRFENGQWIGESFCRGLVCKTPALGEFDLNGRFTFVLTSGGRLLLDSVVLVEGGPVSEEFLNESEVWVTGELGRLAESGCSILPPVAI